MIKVMILVEIIVEIYEIKIIRYNIGYVKSDIVHIIVCNL